MLFKTILILPIFCWLTTPTQGFISKNVVGGQKAKIRDWPFIASLQFYDEKKGFSHFCGGVILDERTILSAAHCYAEGLAKNPKLWIAKLGSANNVTPRSKKLRKWKKHERKNVYKVKKIIRHPGFVMTDWLNDVAVLKLYKNITFGKNVQKARLEDKGHTPPEGMDCRVAGWGSIAPDVENKPKYPTHLFQAIVPIRNLNECRNNFLIIAIKMLKIKKLSDMGNKTLVNGIHTEMNLCAGAEGRDSCSADSGGPLTCEDAKVNGIVSWGIGYCGDYNHPGVYSHVSHFRYWIDKQMN